MNILLVDSHQTKMAFMLKKLKAVEFDNKSSLRDSEDVETGEDSILPIDPEAEKRLVRKCDLHVLPMISVLYLLAFIDRINIGNARIQGLEQDLGMQGNAYNIALFLFFIPYILFEVPSNMLLKNVAPSVWLSAIMLLWGK